MIKDSDLSCVGGKLSVVLLLAFMVGCKSVPTPSRHETFSQYRSDQVPHTLMTKPVAVGRLTSGHGYRYSPTGLPVPRQHTGVDYGAPRGTPVYAAGVGVVDKIYVSASYGKYIRIKHSNGFSTAYAHLDEFVQGLRIGSRVTRGQRIGKVGSTGRSSGPHLHYELIYNDQFVDPLFSLSAEEQRLLTSPP